MARKPQDRPWPLPPEDGPLLPRTPAGDIDASRQTGKSLAVPGQAEAEAAEELLDQGGAVPSAQHPAPAVDLAPEALGQGPGALRAVRKIPFPDGPGDRRSHRKEAERAVRVPDGPVREITVIGHPPSEGPGLLRPREQPQTHPEAQLPPPGGVGVLGQGEAAARYHQEALHPLGGSPGFPVPAETDGPGGHPTPGEGGHGVPPLPVPAGMESRQRLPGEEGRLLEKVVVAVSPPPADGHACWQEPQGAALRHHPPAGEDTLRQGGEIPVFQDGEPVHGAEGPGILPAGSLRRGEIPQPGAKLRPGDTLPQGVQVPKPGVLAQRLEQCFVVALDGFQGHSGPFLARHGIPSQRKLPFTLCGRAPLHAKAPRLCRGAFAGKGRRPGPRPGPGGGKNKTL